jgi:hypothetical protein
MKFLASEIKNAAIKNRVATMMKIRRHSSVAQSHPLFFKENISPKMRTLHIKRRKTTTKTEI